MVVLLTKSKIQVRFLNYHNTSGVFNKGGRTALAKATVVAEFFDMLEEINFLI